MSNRREDFVPRWMAIAIIDVLEVIQIEADNGKYVAAPCGLSHGVMKAVAQKRAIRQTGKDVILRDSPEGLLMLLVGGDVGEEGDVAFDVARLVANGGDG